MGGRGRRHEQELRNELISLIDEAVCAGARLDKACALVGVSRRTLQRWRRGDGDQRRGPKTPPAQQLSKEERSRILALANSPAYRDLTPEKIIAKLADEKLYICSESSLRRLLNQHKLASHRQRCKPATPQPKPREFVAREPLRVLTWDITYLRSSTVRGEFFYLYMFLDIWSRRIVGFEVHALQSTDLAADLLVKVCRDHDIVTHACVVHSDNGSPMKGSTMLATMHNLGITRSFSRPQVSDDNAHIESLFRHLKYAPSYPTRGFADVEHARQWVQRFVDWYNAQHLHSAIGYVTPDDRHHGRDIAILQQRRELYEEARRANPRRWSCGTRKWHRPAIVTLNPDRVVETAPSSRSAAA